MDGSPDPASLQRRVAHPAVARDQEDKALAACDGVIEAAVDCSPRGVEVHPVQVDRPVGPNRAVPQLLVPGAVKCAPIYWVRLVRRDPYGAGDDFCITGAGRLLRLIRRKRWFSISQERANCHRHAAPKLSLFRAEGAHGPQHP